jgi:hypothetical protein
MFFLIYFLWGYPDQADPSYGFNKLTRVDFYHFFNLFLIEFFFQSCPPTTQTFFYLVFFFQFHLSILSCLEIRVHTFFQFALRRVILIS